MSKDRKRRYQANLLLLESPGKSHFVAITNMSRLLKGRVAGGGKSFVCRYCLYCFSIESLLERHEGDCGEYPPLKITYPPSDDNILKFKNFGHTLEVPFTIFADFESLLVPNPDAKKYAIHKLSSIACLTVSSFPQYNSEQMFFYTGEDVMQQFFDHLDREKRRIDEILNRNVPMSPLTPDELREHYSAKTCKNCGTEFDEGVFKRCFHHEHYSGRYLFSCCNRCNLLLKYKQTMRKSKKKAASYEVPIFFHNLTNYDAHLILKHVKKNIKK